MRKIFSLTIIGALLAFSMSSCSADIKSADGKVSVKTFDLKGFDAIDSKGSADVVYTPGTHYSVKVKTTEDEMNRLELTVKNRHLIIAKKRQNFLWQLHTSQVTVYVTSPSLTDVHISGSGSFTCNKELHTQDLTLSISGSGDIDLGKTFAKDVEMRIAGSGSVQCDCLSANDVSYDIAGSGDIKSKEFHTSNSQLNIAGSGSICVDYADCKRADARITGSGSIYLTGTLGALNKKCTGSGDIYVNNRKIK